LLIFEFDPAKEAGNLAKHGLSLATAADLDWDAALVWLDERVDYGEPRQVALARKADVVFSVAFVDRGEIRRVISLRRANKREIRHYVESSQAPEDTDAIRRGGPADNSSSPA
jgi:hypothetical protein